MIRNITRKVLLANFATILFSAAPLLTFSQSATAQKTAISLVSDDGNTTVIRFNPGAMVQQTVNTPAGNAVVIKVDAGTPMLQKDFPDLPKLTTSIIIPDDKNMQVTVSSSSYTDFENVKVAPSKGSLKRDVQPSDVPYVYGSVYQENAFFPQHLAEMRDPYILRDFRGQTVIVYPFQYNPVTKTLRIYSEITVTVSPKAEGTAINILNKNYNDDKIATEFDRVYSNHFLNYQKDTRYTQLEEEGNMLIISYGSFMDEMQPFVDWKRQRGMPTEMVDVATIGNTKTAIKSYVANYYNTNGLTFLLLVGDDPQVKTSSTNAGDSDNDYGFISGNDHYQEIFVGRFSAQTDAEVTTQVNRILAYEKTPIDDNYFAKGICLASNEGLNIGDDGEADYQHEDLIRTQLLDYTYTDVAELFDGTHGNVDAAGNPSDNNLRDLVNAGAGIIQYTGHGSTTSLGTTGFNNADVGTLTNTTKWPFAWIVGCSVGAFRTSTCFAESWARATSNGQPTGALSSFMSTILQSWAEPMEAQDEINLILTESYANKINRTFGGLSINGCFSMNDKYGNSGNQMTDTWIIFGDPSVVVRTAQPTSFSVSHDPSIFPGASTFSVACDMEDALVALTVNGTILATAKVSGGIASLSFNPLVNEDPLTLTVTGYNKTPYLATIAVKAQSSGHVVGGYQLMDDAVLSSLSGTITYGTTLPNLTRMENNLPGNAISVYPNPFDKLASIYYNLPSDAAVTVTIYNQTGQEIKRLIDNEKLAEGSYQFTFDGTSLPPGSYFCQVVIDGKPQVTKLLIAR
ncbi:MAG: C25 family cysteine peptidase [Chitinophagales bacterium]